MVIEHATETLDRYAVSLPSCSPLFVVSQHKLVGCNMILKLQLQKASVARPIGAVLRIITCWFLFYCSIAWKSMCRFNPKSATMVGM
jgi:hypothetical protein